MRIPVLSKLFKQKKPENVTLVDLGTYSAKTSIVQLPQELADKEQVLGEGEQILGETMLRGREIQDLDGVLGVINQSVDQAVVHAGVEPIDLVLGLSGNAIQYRSLKVRLRRSEPNVPITQSELDASLQRIEEETPEKALEKIKKLSSNHFGYVGMLVTGFQVDDKTVTNPVGLSGENMEIIVLHGFWAEGMRSSVDLLANQLGFNIRTVWETAVARALWATKQENSFVLIDVGGRVTSVVVVQNGQIYANVSMNLGADEWTDALSEGLELRLRQADEVKKALHDGGVDQTRAVKAREVLEEAVQVWIDGLVMLLTETKKEITLPDKILFAGQGGLLELVKSKMVAYPWNQQGIFTSFPKIEQISERYQTESLYYVYNLL